MKKIITIIILMFILTLNVEAASNPYGKMQTLYGATTIRCTWYAWQQAYEKSGVALPGWGNAQTWYASAKKSGYSVGKIAKPNSIAVWSSDDGYGHVAYVVSVNGDTMITNEGGIIDTIDIPCLDNPDMTCGSKNVAYNGDGTMDGLIRPTESDELIGYIYLDNAPKSNSSKIETPKTDSKTQTVLKSNNNYLKNLNISNIEFDFNKEVLNYEFEVDYDFRFITIKSEPEDSLSVVTGNGDKVLKEGENNFKIKVLAQDNSTREYTVIIKRKEKILEDKKETKVEIKDVTKENSFDKLVIIGISTAIFCIIIFMLIKNKKKNI